MDASTNNDNRSRTEKQDTPPQSFQPTADNVELNETVDELSVIASEDLYIDSVVSDSQPSSKLEISHIDHLRSEGFADAQILEWEAQGLRSLTAEEAEQRGFKLWTRNGWISGAGIYFPFVGEFGQLRLDEPIQRENGKIAKYLTPVGAKSQAQIPDNCQIITEGAKDARAGLVHGGIATGAIAGVSHYRKALKEGAGYVVIFDSDGWHNPSVFSNLFHAGKYLNGKILLVPTIPGEPKAGLCEYFKSGYTASDYAALIAAAIKPEALLVAWPQHFAKIPAEKLLSGIKVAFRLGAEYLDEVQLELLLNGIRKTTKLSASLLKGKLEEQKRIVQRLLRSRQGESGSSQEQQGENAAQSAPRDPDWVDAETVENLIHNTLFEGGEGSWATLEDTFYRDTGKGYWLRVPDKTVLKLIGLKCKTAYQLKKQDGELVQIFPFFTDAKKKSAFLVCRDSLDLSENLPANQHLRCFTNVTVDLRTGEAIAHDKTHLLTTAIAADYVPDQPCPKVFLDFIKSAYGEDLIETIRAYTSMLLDPTAPYGKFIHLMGPSGSGKGTLLRLWGEMFGLDHFRSGEFNNLASAEARHQYLTGAALFTVPDCGGYITGLKPFYELVDNGPMTGRALFSSNAYQKKWGVRFIIASVDHLQIENSGDGWDRRCLPLPTKSREGNEDPYLGTKLAEVKGQIISWALAMPREERDRLILHPSSNERVQLLKQDAALHGDPVRAFVELCLRPCLVGEIQSHELHSCFAAFAQAHGYQGWGMNKLINHLKTIIPDHYTPRQKKSGNQWIPAHWKNMIFLPKVFIDVSLLGRDEEWEQRQQQLEPQWRCIKSECVEGGLLAFNKFKSGDKGWTSEAYGYPISAKGTPGTPSTPPIQTSGVPAETYIQQALQDIGTPGTPGTPPLFRFLKKREGKKEEERNHSLAQGTTSGAPLSDATRVEVEQTDLSGDTGGYDPNNARDFSNDAAPRDALGKPPFPSFSSSFSKKPDEGGVPGVPGVPDSENPCSVTGTGGTPPSGDVAVHGVPGVPSDEIGYQYASDGVNIGDLLTDSLGRVAQITKYAAGGWITDEGVYVSRSDLKIGSFTKIAPSELSQVQADARMLIDYAELISDHQTLLDITGHWTETHKHDVWQLLPAAMQQKLKTLKKGTV